MVSGVPQILSTVEGVGVNGVGVEGVVCCTLCWRQAQVLHTVDGE